jgi:hypothetical protein
MREFRKKQKRLKKIMNVLVIFSVAFLVIYIGVEPTISEMLGTQAIVIINYVCYAFIIASLIVLFVYYSKYGKCDKFLESIEYELSDNGYYFTSRKEKDIESYLNVVKSDLRNNGYNVDEKVKIDDFEFDVKGSKRNEFFYIVSDEAIDKNDIIAHLDSAIYDITSIAIRRKGNGVILFVCDKADEGAISLSKMITPLGKKEQIKIAIAIVELSTSRCYFLGNRPTKCQQMIANFAMNCDVPIKPDYIGNERLPFQDELEEHMKDFNIKDFNNGTFYAH